MNKNKKNTFNFKRTNEHHTTYKKDWEWDNGINKYEVFHTLAQTIYSHKKPNSYTYENYKAMITLSGYSKFIIKKNIATSQAVAWMELSENEIIGADSILNSTLYQFILNQNKWSGWNSLEVIKVLPRLDMTKVWTDEEIYKEFNISVEEINLINSYVNKPKGKRGRKPKQK
jgi:hypothetical protein